MKIFKKSGAAVANADVMSWTLRAAASAAHPTAAVNVAIPATERPAAATVASVNRGTT